MILKTESESRGFSHISHSSKMLKQAGWEGPGSPGGPLGSWAPGLLVVVLPPRSSFRVKVLTFVLS